MFLCFAFKKKVRNHAIDQEKKTIFKILLFFLYKFPRLVLFSNVFLCLQQSFLVYQFDTNCYYSQCLIREPSATAPTLLPTTSRVTGGTPSRTPYPGIRPSELSYAEGSGYFFIYTSDGKKVMLASSFCDKIHKED